MGVLKLYVDLVNSERQAIWARYATMVVGNSLIFNAIILGGRTSETVNLPYNAAGILLCFGIILCVIWTVMTWVGWNWFRDLQEDAKKLCTGGSINPFTQTKPRHPGVMFFCAMFVPFIFMLVYFIGLVYLR
jgi:hypothetical protein